MAFKLFDHDKKHLKYVKALIITNLAFTNHYHYYCPFSKINRLTSLLLPSFFATLSIFFFFEKKNEEEDFCAKPVFL